MWSPFSLRKSYNAERAAEEVAFWVGLLMNDFIGRGFGGWAALFGLVLFRSFFRKKEPKIVGCGCFARNWDSGQLDTQAFTGCALGFGSCSLDFRKLMSFVFS